MCVCGEGSVRGGRLNLTSNSPLPLLTNSWPVMPFTPDTVVSTVRPPRRPRPGQDQPSLTAGTLVVLSIPGPRSLGPDTIRYFFKGTVFPCRCRSRSPRLFRASSTRCFTLFLHYSAVRGNFMAPEAENISPTTPATEARLGHLYARPRGGRQHSSTKKTQRKQTGLSRVGGLRPKPFHFQNLFTSYTCSVIAYFWQYSIPRAA